VQVVLENRRSPGEGEVWEGTSENYLKVRVHGVQPALAAPGRLISARITGHGDPCPGQFLPVS
jgi:hypothetical protein